MCQTYEVIMTSGDRAEADTLQAAMLAAWTMANDNKDAVSLVWIVNVDGEASEWATKACHVHLREKIETGLLESGSWPWVQP